MTDDEIQVPAEMLTISKDVADNTVSDMTKEGRALPYRCVSIAATDKVMLILAVATDRRTDDGMFVIDSEMVGHMMELSQDMVAGMMEEEIGEHVTPVFAMVPVSMIRLGEHIVAARVLSEKAREN